MLSAYRPFRMLSIVAVAIAAGAAARPPVRMIPTSANWLPPVNIGAESACVCQMVRPAATERAPKLTSYSPVASPTDHDWRRTARRRSGVSSPVGAASLIAPPAADRRHQTALSV